MPDPQREESHGFSRVEDVNTRSKLRAAVHYGPSIPLDSSEVALILLAAAAGLYARAVRQFWVDERITIGMVRRYDLIELLIEFPLRQPHLPTWYYLPKTIGAQLTIAVGMLALGATAVAAYRLARLETGERRAVVVGFAVAVSPYLVVQSSWLRMYGLLWALLSWGLYWGYRGDYRRSMAVFVASSLIHPFGVFGPVWLGIVMAIRGRLSGRRAAVLLGSLVPTAVFLLVNSGPNGLTGRSTGMTHGIQPGVAKIALLPVASVTGGPQLWWHVGIVAALTVALVVLVDYRRQWALVLWVVLPIAGIVAASYLVHPVFRLKYFGMLTPVVVVLFVSNLRTRWQAVLVGGGLGFAVWVSWFYLMIGTVLTRYYALG